MLVCAYDPSLALLFSDPGRDDAAVGGLGGSAREEDAASLAVWSGIVLGLCYVLMTMVRA